MNTSTEPIAVVGFGLVVPGASSADEYWHVLLGDAHQFGEPDRFEIDPFHSPDPGATDKTHTRTSGFVRSVAGDRSFPPPGRWLRHSLEQATEQLHVPDGPALFAVGIAPTGLPELEDHITGIGIDGPAGHENVGGCLPYQTAVASMRDLLPNDTEVVIVDAACSGSLYAVDMGTRALRCGTHDIAVCGGAFALGPHLMVSLAKLGGMSRQGQVRPFDERCDGVLFADAAGVVVLKTLRRARRDGDQVHGVLLSTGAANDGSGKPLTAPSETGQHLAIERTGPRPVDWIIAHGTGTSIGDSLEAATLTRAYPDQPPTTSNKALIGHSAPAAGISSVIHALLALHHDLIPAQSHHTSCPHPLRVPVEHRPFPPTGRPRTVAICGYGLGGTDLHLLLQEAPGRAPDRRP